jgi:type I restriction enzyme R subunit
MLTTSQKLSTGVDARNIRNIVLLRPVHSMIEFKQIIGRGTRLFDGKEYFTIYDFVDAYHHFADPDWDGEPVAEVCSKCGQEPCICVSNPPKTCLICGKSPCTCEKPPKICSTCGQNPCVCEKPPKKKLKIKLRDGKEREITHLIATSFWSADGQPISIQEFMNNMYGALPDFFQSEEELREIWSNPITRKTFLAKIAAIGYGEEQLETLQKMVDAEESDLLDVLAYISFLTKPVSRTQRVKRAKAKILKGLTKQQQDFLRFVLAKYEERGVEELGEDKLPILLNLKYHAIADAEESLGSVDNIRTIFFAFQRNLYARESA